MSENADRARRATELFNETIGKGRSEVPAEARSVWADEPLIVPLRATLEGNQYSGATALEDFAADTVEIWSRLQFEPRELRELGGDHLVMKGRLSGTGRDSGAETEMDVALLIEFDEGRIAVFRTFLSEAEAMKAAGR